MGQRVRIDFSACLMAALLLLLLPLNWLMAAAAAAMVHELCHLAAIRLVGGKVLGMEVGAGGAALRVMPMEPGEELLCALAGPMGSLALLSLCHVFPRVAVCAGVQALFNLIPIYPLDGARILRSGAMLLCPKWAEKIQPVVEWLAVIGISVAAAVLGWVLQMGIGPLIFAATVILKGFLRKIPCKEGRIGVQ